MSDMTDLRVGIGADISGFMEGIAAIESAVSSIKKVDVEFTPSKSMDQQVKALQRQIEQAEAVKRVRAGDTAELQKQLGILREMEKAVTGDKDKLSAQRELNNIYRQREQLIRASSAYERQAVRENAAVVRQAAAEERNLLRENASIQRTIDKFQGTGDSRMTAQLKQQTKEYRKHLEIIQRRIAMEKAGGNNKAVIQQEQMRKAALETSRHYARMMTYGKGFADQLKKANSSMAGLQGYARSTANIIKGILISQMFYQALGNMKQIVAEAAELYIIIESAEATFSGMFKEGQQAAKDLIEILKHEAINTPFFVEDMIKSTRLLSAYGVQAENLMFVMEAIEKATAASGDPQKMETIARAMGQIHTKGVIAGKEVRRLTDAGIAVNEILMEELGLTQEQISKGWAALQIDSATALNALVAGINKRYGLALENMEKTTRQKINNVKESFRILSAELAAPFVQGFGKMLDVIIPKLEQLYKAIRTLGLGDALKTLLPEGVFNTLVSMANSIVRMGQAIKYAFADIANMFGPLFDAISHWGNLIVNTFMTVIAMATGVSRALVGTQEGINSTSRALVQLISILFAVKLAMRAVLFAASAWSAIAIIVKAVMTVAAAMGTVFSAVSGVIGAAAGAAAGPWIAFIGVLLIIVSLVSALTGAFGKLKAAIGGVGAALKNLGGGTKLGSMFKDMSKDLNAKLDEYDKKLADDRSKFTNAFDETADAAEDSKDAVGGAAKATEKAMKGLMSFDEVYKLNEVEPTGGGGAGGGVPDVDVDLDMGDIGDFMGGDFAPGGLDLGDDFFSDIGEGFEDLIESIMDVFDVFKSDEFKTVYDIVKKIALLFAEMWLKSKLMTWEANEQLKKEKASTLEDSEQTKQEKTSTLEDKEQTKQEKTATLEDKEQTKQEKLSTLEDKEQAKQEKASTLEDKEQLASEKKSTIEDKEQLASEKKSTIEDKEQLASEKKSTIEDKEQLAQEKLSTIEDKEQSRLSKVNKTGLLGGVGLGLINAAQVVMTIPSIISGYQRIKEEGVSLETLTPFLSDILFAIIDVAQFAGAIFMIMSALKGTALLGGAAKTVASVATPVATTVAAPAATTVVAGAGGGAAAAIGPVLTALAPIAAIALAVGAIVLFGPQIIDFLKGLADVLVTLLTGLGEALAVIATALLEGFANVITAFLEGVVNIINSLADGISSVVDSIAEAWSKIVTSISDAVVSMARALSEGVVNIINSISQALNSLLNTLTASITLVVRTLGETAVMVIRAVGEFLINLARTVLDGLDRLLTHFDPIIRAIAYAIETMTDALAAPLNSIAGLVDSIAGLVDAVAGYVNTIARNLPTWISDLIRAIGKISINVAMPGSKITNNARGGVFKKGTGVVVEAETVVGNNRFGEAGAEAVVPLERSQFLDLFADSVANALMPMVQSSPVDINLQFEQAKAAAAAQSGATNGASADEIGSAIQSFFTPQMQSPHDAIAQIEPVQINNPMLLNNQAVRDLAARIEEVRPSMGARGKVSTKYAIA